MTATPASGPTRSRRPRYRIAIAAAMLAAGTAGGEALVSGDILVTDFSAHKLYVMRRLGPSMYGPPTELASAGFLLNPIGVAVRKDGFAFVTNVGSQLIVRVDPAAVSPTPVQVALSGLANARGIVIGPSGDAFVSSPSTDEIIRVDTVTGTGIAASASGSIHFPTGLVQEPNGDLVVADSSTNPLFGTAIVRIHPEDGSQAVLSSAGSFLALRDIEIDPSPAGGFLVVDSGARKVFRVDATIPYDPANPGANQIEWAACPGFLEPRGIAVDADDFVLVSDFSAKQVFRIHPMTKACTPLLAAGNPLLGPWDVTVVGTVSPFEPGPLLVAGGTANQVYRVNPMAGTSEPVWPGLSFADPVAVTRDLNGDLLVLEDDRILRMDSGGLLTTVSTFPEPVDLTGIVVQADGELLVTDAENDRLVRVIPGTGEQIVVADETGTLSALLGAPAGLALDLDGTVLVANRGRSVETPVIPSGILRVNPISGTTNIVTNDVQFGEVVAIAVDTNGDYLIADEGNDIVWRFRASTPAAPILYPVSIGNQIESLRGIAVDLNRSVLVSNQGAANILRLDPTNGMQSVVAPLVSFTDIQGIALDEIPLPPPLDSDDDGDLESLDNCRIVANADQTDTNHDGFGNRCDADYDDSGGVGGADFSLFRNAYLTSTGDPGYDPDIDADSDGVIGPRDFGVFKRSYLLAPGPSGRACAGSIPCPAP